mgnify:CR=1 FL=1
MLIINSFKKNNLKPLPTPKTTKNEKNNFFVLKMALAIWMFICFFAFYFVQEGQVNMFYIAAGLIGFIMGGTQSLARSTYSKLIPGTKDTASFFSFYDVCDRLSTVLGTFLFGIIIQMTGNMRVGILILTIFFSVSLLFLYRLNKFNKLNI